jgi:Peptidase dimerisation domain
MASGTLTVQVLEEGVHSGDASGIVPSSFRILRLLLSRLEDERTGAVRPAELYVQVPPERVTQARRAAAALGNTVYSKFPFVPSMSPMTDDLTELVLNRTSRPQLAVTGIDGLPPPINAGNVLLPSTIAKLSLRLPPTLDAEAAGTGLRIPVGEEPALRSSGGVQGRGERRGLERPCPGALARAVACPQLRTRPRGAARLHGRRRQHSVHGDAW